QIWEDVLNVRPIGVKDNFFDLGGHSMAALQLLTQVQKVFDRSLSLSTLSEAATIEKLAGVLRQRKDIRPTSSLVAINRSGIRPPLFFAHPVGGNVICYIELARHLGPDQPFYAL